MEDLLLPSCNYTGKGLILKNIFTTICFLLFVKI